MTMPYVGEIRIFGFSRTPTGWLPCNGSVVSISNYETLYTLIGTTYGGDGVNTFATPDLRGRVPLHQGTGLGLTPRAMGEISGTESVTLMTAQMPSHTHSFTASAAQGGTATPGAAVTLAALPATPSEALYFNPLTGAAADPLMSLNTGQRQGGDLPHDNCAPTLTMNPCISFTGIFPSHS